MTSITCSRYAAESLVHIKPLLLDMYQLEKDFEVASNEYDAINVAMKTELPQFMVMATQFIDPLFHSFYYMQYARYLIFTEFHHSPPRAPQTEHLLPHAGEAQQLRRVEV